MAQPGMIPRRKNTRGAGRSTFGLVEERRPRAQRPLMTKQNELTVATVLAQALHASSLPTKASIASMASVQLLSSVAPLDLRGLKLWSPSVSQ